jgi:hypothetical protein
VDGPVPIQCDPPNGSFFIIGTAPVKCWATDSVGNRSPNATFTVTVKDLSPPAVFTPEGQVFTASSPLGYQYNFTFSSTDNVDTPDQTIVSCVPASSGYTFKIGTTTVTCTGRDRAGNFAKSSFTVTILDDKPYLVSNPIFTRFAATNAAGALVKYSLPIFRDYVPNSPLSLYCSPPPGSLFPIGFSTVSCTVTNSASGLSSLEDIFSIEVVDLTPPAVPKLPNLIVPADSSLGSIVSYVVPDAIDNVEGAIPLTCNPPPGSLFTITNFTIGAAVVSCYARDSSGNQSPNIPFTITVTDKTPPVLTIPAGQVFTATSFKGYQYNFAATAIDNVDPPSQTIVTCVPPSTGTFFAIGSTPVTCTSKDKAGNFAKGSFTVTVLDDEPFLVSNPILTRFAATNSAGAIVRYSLPIFRDYVANSPLSLFCAPAPGSLFPIGSSPVTCNVTNTKTNLTSLQDIFTIEVVDLTPPAVPILAKLTITTPSSSGAIVSYDVPDAIDNVDGSVPLSCIPPSGSFFPIATTSVKCSARDAAGNQSPNVIFQLQVKIGASAAELEQNDVQGNNANEPSKEVTIGFSVSVAAVVAVLFGLTAVFFIRRYRSQQGTGTGTGTGTPTECVESQQSAGPVDVDVRAVTSHQDVDVTLLTSRQLRATPHVHVHIPTTSTSM